MSLGHFQKEWKNTFQPWCLIFRVFRSWNLVVSWNSLMFHETVSWNVSYFYEVFISGIFSKKCRNYLVVPWYPRESRSHLLFGNVKYWREHEISGFFCVFGVKNRRIPSKTKNNLIEHRPESKVYYINFLWDCLMKCHCSDHETWTSHETCFISCFMRLFWDVSYETSSLYIRGVMAHTVFLFYFFCPRVEHPIRYYRSGL